MDASPWGVKQIWRVWARRWIRLRLVRYRTIPSGYLWLIQLRWGWTLWYRLGRGFVCTAFPDRSFNEETVRPEVETQGAEIASLIQLTVRLVQCWSSCTPVSPRVSPLHPEGPRGGYSGLPRPSWWPFSRQNPLVTRSSLLRPEKLMLSGGSGCDPITSSPLISPRLWSQGSLISRYGGLQGLSGTSTLQGGLRP